MVPTPEQYETIIRLADEILGVEADQRAICRQHDSRESAERTIHDLCNAAREILVRVNHTDIREAFLANPALADLEEWGRDPSPATLDAAATCILNRLDRIIVRYGNHLDPKVVRVERMALAAYGCVVAAFPHLDSMTRI